MIERHWRCAFHFAERDSKIGDPTDQFYDSVRRGRQLMAAAFEAVAEVRGDLLRRAVAATEQAGAAAGAAAQHRKLL